MRIAVVDDEPDIVLLWSIALDDVVTASTTQEARDLDWPTIDGAILDYRLAGSDQNGVQFAEWLHENHPHVRTVLVTAAIFRDEIPPSMEGRVMEKPASAAEVVARLMQ